MSDYIETILRSLLLVFALFVLTRALGKKQLAEMNIFEYITGIVLGSIAAIFSFDLELKVTNGLLAMLVWFIIPFIVERISLKSKKFRNFVSGRTTILIEDGKVIQENLRKEALTLDELLSGLRTKDIFRVADVEFATLEPSGKLSVMPKRMHQPLTAYDLKIKLPNYQEAETVIIDGQLILGALDKRGLKKNWLLKQLKNRSVTLDQVFLGQIDTNNELTLHLYDEQESTNISQ